MNLLKSENLSIVLICVGIFALLTLPFIFFWGLGELTTTLPADGSRLGQFGDFVGGFIGSLWSLAGVLLFYLALKEQRQDFKINQRGLEVQLDAFNQQIEEFRLQRVELESSRKIYEQQSKTLQIQQFESNFYSLMNVYSSIKSHLTLVNGNEDYFRKIYNGIQINYDGSDELFTHHSKVVNNYIDAFNENSGDLSHYFKAFYRIIKIVDSHFNLSDQEKLFYSKIIRSQLTDYEQIVLFYNSYTLYGEKARPLILKYNLLKHVPNFKRSEFDYWYKKQNNSQIHLFASWLDKFLVNNIPSFYNLDFEADKIEEDCEYFGCIIGIYFSDKIELKVYCKLDISENGIFLSDGEFRDFIHSLLIDKIQLKGYIMTSNIKFEKYITTTETNKIFGYSIESVSKIEI